MRRRVRTEKKPRLKVKSKARETKLPRRERRNLTTRKSARETNRRQQLPQP